MQNDQRGRGEGTELEEGPLPRRLWQTLTAAVIVGLAIATALRGWWVTALAMVWLVIYSDPHGTAAVRRLIIRAATGLIKN